MKVKGYNISICANKPDRPVETDKPSDQQKDRPTNGLTRSTKMNGHPQRQEYSQWTKQNRQRAHSVGFNPTYCYETAGCKQQLVVKITAGCHATKSAKIQLSPNRMRPANS